MRKVRNTIHYSNPLAMFADGVEQIIREKTERPTSYTDHELAVMMQNEQTRAAKPVELTRSRSLKVRVVDLIQDLFSYKLMFRSN